MEPVFAVFTAQHTLRERLQTLFALIILDHCAGSSCRAHSGGQSLPLEHCYAHLLTPHFMMAQPQQHHLMCFGSAAFTAGLVAAHGRDRRTLNDIK